MSKRDLILIFVSFFLATILVYSPTFQSSFLSDDWIYLTAARDRPVSLGSYFLNNVEGKREGGVYRPLVSLSFLLNYKINGLTTWPYHLFNVFFHAAAVWLFFILIRLLQRAGNAWLPMLSAFFFLVLPSHAEAVNWLSSRGDLLVAIFYLAALIFYILFRRRGQNKFLIFSLAAFLAALFSKEMALTLPLVILITELFFERSPAFHPLNFTRRIKFGLYLSFYFILIAVYLLLRFLSTGIFLGFYAAPNLKPEASRLIYNFSNYLLSQFFHGDWRVLAFSYAAAHQLIFWLLAAAIFIWAARCVRSQRPLFWFASFFFVLTLLPVISLPLQRLDSEGERFVYLSSLGFCLALALTLTEKIKPRSLLATILIAGYFIFFLVQKNIIWQRAASLSQNLLFEFGQSIETAKGGGIVILGMPDSLNGAYIWRNGFPQALSLVYPEYKPDVLVAQPKLKLFRRDAAIIWRTEPGGLIGGGVEDKQGLFFGPLSLNSFDYEMEIKNYQPEFYAGDSVEFKFTPEFLAQLRFKPIAFLAYNQSHLTVIDK